MPHTEIDVNATVAVATEKATLQTKLSLAMGAIGVLSILVNFFLTREITSTASKIETTNTTLTKLSSTVEIQQVRSDWQGERIGKLEAAKEAAAQSHSKIDDRLNSIEQRLAIHDQIIQAQK